MPLWSVEDPDLGTHTNQTNACRSIAIHAPFVFIFLHFKYFLSNLCLLQLKVKPLTRNARLVSVNIDIPT